MNKRQKKKMLKLFYKKEKAIFVSVLFNQGPLLSGLKGRVAVHGVDSAFNIRNERINSWK